MAEDDEHYTTGEHGPASYIPKGVQFVVATACTAVVVSVIILACCLAKSQCAWHEPLVRVAKRVEGTERRRRRAEERQRRRALRETEVSPLRRGAFATIMAYLPTVESVLGRQTYLQVWKGLKTRARQKTVATYFGYPTVVWFFMWLLYATFNSRRSTGDIEQYLALLSFVFVLQSTASTLCVEKAAKLRESLRAMGLRELAYWAGPLIVDGLLYASALAFLLSCVVVPCRLLHNAGRGNNVPVTFVQFWEVFGLFQAAAASFVSVACVISTVCGSALAASQLAFAVTIASVVLFVVLKITEPASFRTDFIELWLAWPPTALQTAALGTASFTGRYPSYKFQIDLPRVIRWLWLDAVLWALLALYLGEVVPQEFGVANKWWFPLAELRSWLGRTSEVATPDDYEPLEGGEDDVGAVEFAGLAKTFGSLKAVDGAALRLNHGECTCLLGHNGAGKTTLLRMLTGLLPPDARTSATARAYGVDLLKRGTEGTAPLGVVPQHDVLWEELTVREHAHFCAVLKSGGWDATAAADELLRTFHLDDRLAHFGSELSGGMRRKLSTVCALSGNSKFVVLDEPTTGLDPLARRELWDVLAREKKGRCLLLTTHYMDEADELGDVVAIMVGGKIRCADAPAALKRSLGWGAKLVVEVLEDTDARDTAGDAPRPTTPPDAHAEGEIKLRAPSPEPEVVEENGELMGRVAAIVQRTVPGARAWERRFDDDGDSLAQQRVIARTAPRLEFALPVDAPVAACLEALEALPVRVGVGGTDLEDVFLRVGDEEERRRANLLSAPPARAFARVDDGNAWRAIRGQAQALVTKRLRTAWHDPGRTALSVALPVVSAVIAFACNAKDKFGPRGSFPANATTCVICMLGFVPLVGLIAEHVAAERASKLRNVLTVAGCDARAYWLGTLCGDLCLLLCVALCFSTIATITGTYGGPYKPDPTDAIISYKRSEHLSQAVADTPSWALDLGAREYGPQVPAASRAPFVDDDARRAIETENGWLMDDLLDDPAVVHDAFLHKIINEAVTKAGDPTVGQALDATGHHLDDDASLTIDTLGPIEEVYGLRKWRKLETWLFPPLFVAQCAAFAYLISFASSGPRSAVVLAPMAVLGLLFVPMTVLAFVNLSLGEQGANLIHLSSEDFLGVLYWGASISVPHGAFLMEMFRISTDLSTHASGFPSRPAVWIICIVELVLFLYAAYRLDDRAAAFKVKRIEAPLLDVLEADVSAERERAFSGDAALVLRGVRKVYNTGKPNETVAVSNLSLRVELGEIFGLLGANGAGKTSAINVVMRAAFPTAGDALVRGYSVLDDFKWASTHLGVVTQTDTLYDALSCAEHLDLFLDLRLANSSTTVSSTQRALVVARMLEDVELGDAPDRLAARLSGGMKRKLCVACALVGEPSVVLLDEPSAGLDPVSRRRLWTVLRRAMVGRAVVLTTHSMEEAEALCTRTAIMASGQLRAIGTPLSLKRKNGAGWRLSIRTRADVDAAAITSRICALAPGAAVRATTRRCVVELSVPDRDHMSGVFAALEADVANGDLGTYGAIDFTLEQPKLEDVFLRVVARAAETDAAVEEAPSIPMVDAEDVEAPLAVPMLDAPSEASAEELARCCFGLDRRAHAFLAWVLSAIALVLWFSVSGLLGPIEYDDDRPRSAGSDPDGCHHEKGKEPCAVAAVYMNGLPFLIAFVGAVLGCCGVCCCIPKKADSMLATGAS